MSIDCSENRYERPPMSYYSEPERYRRDYPPYERSRSPRRDMIPEKPAVFYF